MSEETLRFNSNRAMWYPLLNLLAPLLFWTDVKCWYVLTGIWWDSELLVQSGTFSDETRGSLTPTTHASYLCPVTSRLNSSPLYLAPRISQYFSSTCFEILEIISWFQFEFSPEEPKCHLNNDDHQEITKSRIFSFPCTFWMSMCLGQNLTAYVLAEKCRQ
jgi:hypothetical protein